jgi:hypothetical protein
MIRASSLLLALGACGHNTTERAAAGGLGGAAVGGLVAGPVSAGAGAADGTLVHY